MDRKLARELARIAADREAGAAELALQASAATMAWLRRNRHPSQMPVALAIRAIAAAQPSMAPLWNLANNLGLAWDSSQDFRRLLQEARDFRRKVLAARGQIAKRFLKLVRHLDKPEILTYSFSSTVSEALIRSSRHIAAVTCSESRPGNEGRRMATELAHAKIPVKFLTEAQLFSAPMDGKVIVLGLDAITPEFVVGKIGCAPLLDLAARAESRIFLLADRSKFRPATVSLPFDGSGCGDPAEVWQSPPEAVTVSNLLLAEVHLPSSPRIQFLTELGAITPRQVRRHLSMMKLSTLLSSSSH